MSYLPNQLPSFVKVCQKQRPKDEQFVDEILGYLRPGPCLELGGGCGQIAEILASRGVEVSGSDIEPFFVDYQRQRGLDSRVVDAMNIAETAGNRFDNIITQGVSTLVTKDLRRVRACYESVLNALNPRGRLIFIFPNAYGRTDKPWSKVGDHWPIIRDTGFGVVAHFRHQLLPSVWYHRLSPLVTKPMERSIGRRFGLRNVFVLERPNDHALSAA